MCAHMRACAYNQEIEEKNSNLFKIHIFAQKFLSKKKWRIL